MKKARILLDIDGVVADFRSLYVACCNQANGTSFTVHDTGKGWDIARTLHLNRDQQNNTWKLIKEPRRASSMSALPGAVGAINELSASHDVYFLTSPVPSPTWVSDRNEWLVKHFGLHLGSKVIYTSHKSLVAGHIFVDDKPEAVVEWCDAMAAHFTEPSTGVMWTENTKAVKQVREKHNFEDDSEFDASCAVTTSWKALSTLASQMRVQLNDS